MLATVKFYLQNKAAVAQAAKQPSEFNTIFYVADKQTEQKDHKEKALHYFSINSELFEHTNTRVHTAF